MLSIPIQQQQNNILYLIPHDNLSALLNNTPLLNLSMLSGVIDWIDPKPVMPPKYYQTYEEIVEGAGFAHESHSVTTEDGYVLNVFRIMNTDVQAGTP